MPAFLAVVETECRRRMEAARLGREEGGQEGREGRRKRVSGFTLLGGGEGREGGREGGRGE